MRFVSLLQKIRIEKKSEKIKNIQVNTKPVPTYKHRMWTLVTFQYLHFKSKK